MDISNARHWLALTLAAPASVKEYTGTDLVDAYLLQFETRRTFHFSSLASLSLAISLSRSPCPSICLSLNSLYSCCRSLHLHVRGPPDDEQTPRFHAGKKTQIPDILPPTSDVAVLSIVLVCTYLPRRG